MEAPVVIEADPADPVVALTGLAAIVRDLGGIGATRRVLDALEMVKGLPA